MKKTLLILAAVAMVFGMAMTASAATAVSVTLTSPTITKATGACEKAGAVTFTFPAGSTLNAGDWWYMDLPEGATLCKGIDYLIVGDSANAAGTPNHYVYVDTTLPTFVHFKDAATDRLQNIPVDNTSGPLDTVPLVAGDPVVVTGNMAIRVIGNSGSRRVTMYVASDDGTGAISVPADTNLTIKILDGSAYQGGTVAGNTRVITNAFGSTLVKDFTDVYGTSNVGAGLKYVAFGQSPTDTFPGANLGNVLHAEFIGSYPPGQKVPYVENTLCVNAEHSPGNLFVSFASLNDKFTFSGDSQIAHTGTANAISLKSCVGNKVAVNDKIAVVSGQGTCDFEYDAHANYCSHVGYAAAIYLMSDTVFGELNDLYDIVIESKTAGVYFGGDFALKGLTSGQTPCGPGGVAIAPSNPIQKGQGASDTLNGAILSYPAATCSPATGKKIDKIYTYGGSISGIQNYKYMVFDLPTFVYDNAVVVAGTEVNLQVTLQKYPCGKIFSDTITIGSFVATCTTGTPGSTTLLYPYMLGTKYNGWFAGFVVTNGSSQAGSATLTAVDDNGNKATFETPEIPAMGSFNASFLTVADWTQDAGNKANFDMTENFVVKVVCKFESGGGMAFLGNMVEGYAVGYDAYSSAW